MCRFTSWSSARIAALLVMGGLLGLPAAQSDITGFSNGTGWTINDAGEPAVITGDTLQITSNTNSETHGVWFDTPQKVSAFTASYTYQLDPASPVPNEYANPPDHGPADGMTFTIQNDPRGNSALGGGGGSMGYTGIKSSAGVVFNVWGDHTRGTQLWEDGNSRFFIALASTTGGIDLLSTNPIKVDLTYDGKTLTEVVTDTVTSVSLTFTYSLDVTAPYPDADAIADASGKAIVGFTGATGGAHSLQKITAFTFKEGP
jgi:Bacterial lectin